LSLLPLPLRRLRRRRLLLPRVLLGVLVLLLRWLLLPWGLLLLPPPSNVSAGALVLGAAVGMSFS
jgi:hypothetical protein